MSQLFPRSSNTLAKLSLIALAFGVVAVVLVLYMNTWSSYRTQEGVARLQPVPFSHRHHVQGVGLDCRYCHTGVEKSSFAGLPPTKTCMTCHSQLFIESPMLKPVRESYEKKLPIHWQRVQKLPDFVYFDHSIHINKGVGCSTCHGEVQKMTLTWEKHVFHMRECLTCHRQPELYLRPRSEVFNMNWQPPRDQRARGERLAREYHLERGVMVSCSTCHR